jgi:hypothetical protein
MKYLAVAVEEDLEEVFFDCMQALFPELEIKQVVLDQIDFSEVETLS